MWRNLTAGIRGLLHKRKAEMELDDELSDFVERATTDGMKRGMSREEAQRAARLELGGIEPVKENVRAVSWEAHVEALWTDLKFGARLLRFNLMFAAAAILSLALGIGANTAIFQLLDAVQMRALPVKNPENLAGVKIMPRNGASGEFSSRYPDLTYALWEQIRKQQEGFSNIAAWSPARLNISPSGEVHNVEGLWVSGDFFETLGVKPAVGRMLSTSDDQPGCGGAGVVLSDSFWQREYGGSADVIGRNIRLNRHPFPIIGVARGNFHGVETGRYFDLAAPLCAEAIVDGEEAMLPLHDGWWLATIGRLRPGWTIERTTAQLRALSPGIFQETLPEVFNPAQAKHFLEYKLGAYPAGTGVSELRVTFANPLWLMLALAGLVLVIASVNLTSLLLARASAREKEMGMRLAIGASRGRLMRQLLAESLLLAGIGAAIGAALAQSLSRVMIASLSTRHDPLFVDLGMDWRVLGFTIGLAFLTCILFGLAPAMRGTRLEPGSVLKEGGRGSTGGRTGFGLRRVLVVSQIALSLALLIAALLFTKSLGKLANVDAGFQENGILAADLDFTTLKLPEERRIAFSQELLDRVRAIPGLDSAALADIVPLSGNMENHDILPGISSPPKEDSPVAGFDTVSPGYFKTLETPILAGRDFNEHDEIGAPLVTIVNQQFAAKIAKTANPVGTVFRIRRMNKIYGPYEIVGMVKDTKYGDLREDPLPIVYLPEGQAMHPGNDAQVVIRSRLPLAELLPAVKTSANEASAGLDVSFYPLHEKIEEGLLRDRLMAQLSGFFGALAVLLAVIGLYGVISYSVARRRNEIGIRMTLGATRNSILGLVLRESVVLLAIGLPIGAGLAVSGSSMVSSMLFGLKAYDAMTIAMAMAMLAAIALLGSYLPALKASRLDPMDALRHE